MTKRTSWMNIYKSGYFHRKGKPDTLDVHAGDFYDSYEQAIKEIDPPSHYVATVPFEWEDVEGITVNPSDSVALPLSATRKRWYGAIAPAAEAEHVAA